MPSGPAGPSENSNISIGFCEPVVQFRYTPVQMPPVPNPLFSNVFAVAITFPSGDRDSADHVGGALQPDAKTQAPTTTTCKTNLCITSKMTIPALFIGLIAIPFRFSCGMWFHSPAHCIHW